MSATLVFAGCACDCNDKTSENGFKMEDGNNSMGTTNGSDANGNANNGGTDNDTYRGNTSTNTGNTNTGNTSTGDDASANGNSAKTKTPDPRKYGTGSGGVGYRNDTLDEYDGLDGSARDKGDIDDVPNPR